MSEVRRCPGDPSKGDDLHWGRGIMSAVCRWAVYTKEGRAFILQIMVIQVLQGYYKAAYGFVS